ncbi:hypothetical protein K2173_009064 [Erythroxylum novogranatense]|uniref:Uncharacterized protein n=1 Tax=Erythroxylum novogranatense TaxID=1862640 RepID=A0AAV8TSU6_9ROSI|nr:hypothetical protein K2173_009064 [Erythroxylum novogranatense]
MLFPSLRFLILLSLTLCSLSPTFAVKKSYIVYLGAHEHSRYGRQVTDSHQERATNSHHEFLASFLKSTEKAKEAIIYSYNKHINGFSALLEEEEAAQIAQHPNVVSVFPSRGKKLHTTHSWEFLNQEKNGVIHAKALMNRARYGEDVIIANLDTGVWPESKSFSDEGYGPVPSRYYGICQNNTREGVPCNKKIIGARFYSKDYERAIGSPLDTKTKSPRDFDGHGTHTLSTAAGDFVPGASTFGKCNGTAKGGSPKARVAAYKVCWPQVGDAECMDGDILKGFDDAINDGVDVLSMSLGGPPMDYFEDALAIGSFHAVKNNVVVVASAGNSGPEWWTVSNAAPWMITVAAGTIDREITNFAVLGNGERLKGLSLTNATAPDNKFYPLVTADKLNAANVSSADAGYCYQGSLDPCKAKGKIILCMRGYNGREEKSSAAAAAGAVGMILYNTEEFGDDLESDPHFVPATHVTYKSSQVIFAYLNSTNNPVGYITNAETKFDMRAPSPAEFSSRGPNYVTPDILKPDVTAPGVDILAAYSLAVAREEGDDRRVPFERLSGTSMSCPHVSGVVGLLKTLHPDWSPAAIRSAIMTSARTRDNWHHTMVDWDSSESIPFTHGSGYIRPNRAMDPGLVYDMSEYDYIHFLCATGYNDTMLQAFNQGPRPYKCPESASLLDFNYPSFTTLSFTGKAIFSRRVTNVGKPGTYVPRIIEPYGISVKVEPSSLKFERVGEELSFKLTLEAKSKPAAMEYLIGALHWTDGHHYVRSPIIVRADQ